MKRILCCLLALTLLAGAAPAFLTGCGRQPAQKKSIRIGVTVYDQYDTFIGEMMKYFTALAQQREQEEQITITLMRESANRSQPAQNNQVEAFIEAGCDVICVNLVDRTDVSLIIDSAEAAGVPILFFNRELVKEDLERSSLLYYVGAEAAQSGRMQGGIVLNLYSKNAASVDKNGDGIIQYVMLEGEAGHQDAIVRTESSIKTLMAGGIPVERLGDEIANWVRSEAETKMMQWLQSYGEAIELVFANNDDMALGAIDALKRTTIPIESWPVIVGIDGTPVGLEAVKNGEMAGTVYNDGPGQAKALLDLAFALSTGGPLPPLEDERYIRLPYKIVTSANVDEFLVATNGTVANG